MTNRSPVATPPSRNQRAEALRALARCCWWLAAACCLAFVLGGRSIGSAVQVKSAQDQDPQVDSSRGRLGPVPPDTLPDELEIEWEFLFPGTSRVAHDDNPVTLAKVELGRRLFFDPILSDDGTVACASCHDPRHGFASPDPLAVGIRGQHGRRNSPTLLNVSLGRSFFWDGRSQSLEDQVLQPISNPLELGSQPEDVVKRLSEHDEYPLLFAAAFDEPLSPRTLAQALASFQRVLASSESAVDRFEAGEVTALSTAAKQGLWLFESRARCWMCHSGANLTDGDLHNTGVSWGAQPPDFGLFETTEIPNDHGRFKTPTLREVARTAPYMHDGSLATLEEVVDYYNKGGQPNAHLDPIIQPLQLSEEDKHNLVEFLRALNGSIDWGNGSTVSSQQ